jgi:hypothetical protein
MERMSELAAWIPRNNDAFLEDTFAAGPAPPAGDGPLAPELHVRIRSCRSTLRTATARAHRDRGITGLLPPTERGPRREHGTSGSE